MTVRLTNVFPVLSKTYLTVRSAKSDTDTVDAGSTRVLDQSEQVPPLADNGSDSDTSAAFSEGINAEIGFEGAHPTRVSLRHFMFSVIGTIFCLFILSRLTMTIDISAEIQFIA